MITISNFQYGDVSSHRFSLIIGSIGRSSGVDSIDTFGSIEVETDRAADRVEPFEYAARLSDKLEFPMTIVNKHGEFYESWEVQIIQGWLFGRKSPQYLTIFEPDKMNESFICRLINPQILKVAGRVYGWSFTVSCSVPYGVTDEKETVIDCSSGDTEYSYWNHSSVEGYIYPFMIIQLVDGETDVSIINKDDDDFEVAFTGLRADDTIRMDNNLKYVKTDSGDKVINNFNLNFFRAVDGLNRLRVTGKCVITIRTRFRQAVGGQ